MREELIKRHNDVVKSGALVYVLGDMFWRTINPQEAVEIVERMNGEFYYILGNHEEAFENRALREQFVWIKERAYIHPEGYPRIVLDHYAGRVWNGSHRGAWQLYGHSHGQLTDPTAGITKEESPFAFDIGVDAWNYYPVSIEQVCEKMKSKGWLQK